MPCSASRSMSPAPGCLSGGHHHGHSHGHAHGHDHERRSRVASRSAAGALDIEVFEDGVPPRFRVRRGRGDARRRPISPSRPSGPTAAASYSSFEDRGGYLESRDEIPEPHAFLASVRLMQAGQHHERELEFEEHEHDARHGAHHRDNNMRAAVIHVMADAAVSVLVIVGLLLARAFGWLWMDPLAGLIGALVIANWSFGLLRDTGGILLDRTPDPRMAEKVRDSDRKRGRPGHRPASLAARARTSRRHRLGRHRQGEREAAHYRQRLARFADLSHVTVEVQHAAVPAAG